MNLIRELDNPCTQEYVELKEYVHGSGIPWFYQPTTGSVHDDEGKKMDIPLWGHHVMVRPNLLGKPYSTITSDSFESCCTVLGQIFAHNGIQVSVIYRINFNLTYNNRNKLTPWHQDLEFPHSNMLIYLNKFGNGCTYVRDGDTEERHTPKEDGIILFGGEFDHRHSAPKRYERRIVMVVNFLELIRADLVE